ncbi:MAG TPA: hypothetical protein VNT60_07200 [Deinococcales bacterium]|nr:hypothetical protein [Deinococcales bacterium]
MKAHLGVIQLKEVKRPASVSVRLASAEAAQAFRDAAEQQGLRVVDGGAIGAARQSPALVTAIVLGSLFALIGLQGVNALLGLPRLDTLLYLPAGLAGLIFTALGICLGLLVGSVIALEAPQGQECTVRVRGDRGTIVSLAGRYGGQPH